MNRFFLRLLLASAGAASLTAHAGAVAVVPEPSMLPLLGVGIVAAAVVTLRRRRK